MKTATVLPAFVLLLGVLLAACGENGPEIEFQGTPGSPLPAQTLSGIRMVVSVSPDANLDADREEQVLDQVFPTLQDGLAGIGLTDADVSRPGPLIILIQLPTRSGPAPIAQVQAFLDAGGFPAPLTVTQTQ